jgi:hypothetical protein
MADTIKALADSITTETIEDSATEEDWADLLENPTDVLDSIEPFMNEK